MRSIPKQRRIIDRAAMVGELDQLISGDTPCRRRAREAVPRLF
jgi:ornithine cyclodeaminase/alanine dehydrogenase-like protein (mu-crystallin family)